MTTKEEKKEVLPTSEVAEIVGNWAEEWATKFILGENTAEHTDLISAIVKMVGVVRQFHDEAAKEQGNRTIRGQKAPSEKKVDEDAAKAKVAAAFGK